MHNHSEAEESHEAAAAAENLGVVPREYHMKIVRKQY